MGKNKIKIGVEAPSFKIKSYNVGTIDLSDLIGKQKIILISVLIIVIVFLSYVSIQSFWADIYYRRAEQLAKYVKSWKKAAIEYEKAISISPKNAEYQDKAGELYSKLAVLYRDDRYFNKAIYHYLIYLYFE